MNEQYTIEKGIPIPERSGRNKYNVGKMEIGDSLLIPGISKANGIRIHMHRLGWKCTQHALEDGTVRVWRTA